jgi:hypothetical protein
MEHKNRDQIRDVADILPSYLQARPLSKRERLELWIEALEREGGRRLRTLFEIEYAPTAKRAGLRAVERRFQRSTATCRGPRRRHDR